MQIFVSKHNQYMQIFVSKHNQYMQIFVSKHKQNRLLSIVCVGRDHNTHK